MTTLGLVTKGLKNLDAILPAARSLVARFNQFVRV